MLSNSTVVVVVVVTTNPYVALQDDYLLKFSGIPNRGGTSKVTSAALLP